jgi:hypothetical protein
VALRVNQSLTNEMVPGTVCQGGPLPELVTLGIRDILCRLAYLLISRDLDDSLYKDSGHK